MHYASMNDYLKILDIIESCKEDVNDRSREGYTALHFAAANNAWESIDILLKMGADVNARDKDGYTPLHWSFTNPNIVTIKQLLNYGADILAEVVFPRLGETLYAQDNILSLLSVEWLEEQIHYANLAGYNYLGRKQLIKAVDHYNELGLISNAFAKCYKQIIKYAAIEDIKGISKYVGDVTYIASNQAGYTSLAGDHSDDEDFE
jgi:ankyrin repeat protein